MFNNIRLKEVCLIFLLFLPIIVCAQNTVEDPDRETTSVVNLGLGFGLDYGGIGVSLSGLPDPHFALFGSVGYAIAGTGYNIGGKIRFNPQSRFCFTSGYMYGYNGALKISGLVDYQKVYYGSSIFVGGDIRSRRNPKNFLSIEIIVPFHDPAFQQDVNTYRAMGANINDPSPVNFSIGYHIGF